MEYLKEKIQEIKTSINNEYYNYISDLLNMFYIVKYPPYNNSNRVITPLSYVDLKPLNLPVKNELVLHGYFDYDMKFKLTYRNKGYVDTFVNLPVELQIELLEYLKTTLPFFIGIYKA